MKIFQVNNLHISGLTIIADDLQHATHIFLQALHHGFRHWPEAEYAIGQYEPVHARQTEPLFNWAAEHRAGIAHRCNDGGWELISPHSEE